jgi:hypothetical protein
VRPMDHLGSKRGDMAVWVQPPDAVCGGLHPRYEWLARFRQAFGDEGVGSRIQDLDLVKKA